MIEINKPAVEELRRKRTMDVRSCFLRFEELFIEAFLEL